MRVKENERKERERMRERESKAILREKKPTERVVLIYI